MAVSILVGGENFDELRNSGCYYVDKTELLYELRQDLKNKVTLFTRPRRFGKTLTMHMMYSHFGRPVILLIDEYDVPLAKANEEKEAGERYYGQMLDVIRGTMSTALKSNDYLEFAVVTGCLRIAKESIFTGVNNFASYSVLDERFSRYFGFTQHEVDTMLKDAELEEKSDTFKEWYDGYIFGSDALYCPWDVVNYVSALLYRKTSKPKNYWKNTSGNAIIRAFAERKEFQVKRKFETLMNGGHIVQTISDELTDDANRRALIIEAKNRTAKSKWKTTVKKPCSRSSTRTTPKGSTPIRLYAMEFPFIRKVHW